MPVEPTADLKNLTVDCSEGTLQSKLKEHLEQGMDVGPVSTYCRKYQQSGEFTPNMIPPSNMPLPCSSRRGQDHT